MKYINFLKKNEIQRFLLVGLVNTGLTYIIYLFFLWLKAAYWLAYSFSFLMGIFISYAINSYYVFHQPLSIKKALQFPLVYLVQYFFGLIILHILIGQLHLNAEIAPLFVVMLSLPITYTLSRFIIER